MLDLETILFFVLVIVLVFALGYYEYTAHDCIPGKKCQHYVEPPKKTDKPLKIIDKVYLMVQHNYDYVTWRQSLLVGILFSILVVFYLKGRIPTVTEWIIVSLLIFVGTYLSFSWIWAHFLYPNSKVIERNLILLRDKLVKEMKCEDGVEGSKSNDSIECELEESNDYKLDEESDKENTHVDSEKIFNF